jgi:hypothetical protein
MERWLALRRRFFSAWRARFFACAELATVKAPAKNLSGKARNYADFRRICQISVSNGRLGAGGHRAMLCAVKKEIKTVSYSQFAEAHVE